MRLYEAVNYLKDLNDRFLEQELDELTRLLLNKKFYCDKVHEFIKASVERASNRCLGQNGWQIEDGASGFTVHENLPKGGIRRHMVALQDSNVDKPATCNCQFFACLEMPCTGIVTAIKKIGQDPYDVKWLPSQWRASSHPLAPLAMQRVGASVVRVQEHVDTGDQDVDMTSEAANLSSRVAMVASIPYPSSERVRRASMTEAFNTMRDTHHPYNHPVKYRAVMAALFDLGAGFNGTPGQWIQEQLPSTRFSSQTWSTNGDLLPPPANLANPQSAKGKPRPGPPITVAAYNKKWKGGRCPTVDQLREAKGDWTLHRPAGKSAEWTCPLPGCTIRPIKNNDQSRHDHRLSIKHKQLLQKYPTEASIAGGGEGASVIPAAGVNSDTGIPGAGGGEGASGIPAAGVNSDTGIPGAGGGEGASGLITDSCMQEVLDENPMLASSTLSPQERISAVGAAAMTVVARRSRSKSGQWQRMNCEVLEIPTIAIPASFYLPWSATKGQEQFKVNQYCEDCTNSSLCSVHEAMVPTKKMVILRICT